MQKHEAHGSSKTKITTGGTGQLKALINLIRDDAFAMSFQSVRQYREAILKGVRDGVEMADCFYLQDSRQIVGNDMMWWAKGGCGYTSDVSKAEVYTLADAQLQHNCRETDIPWPKDYIDAKTRPAVDCQYVSRKEALAGTGIALAKPVKPRREQYRCCHCGIFLTMHKYYGDCPKCGGSNLP